MRIIAWSIALLFHSFAFAGGPKTVVEVSVTEKGFEPSSISVKPDQDVVLKITRKTDSTCSTSVQVPEKKIKKDLPLNKTVLLELGVLKQGEIRFGCGMNMMEGGRITVL